MSSDDQPDELDTWAASVESRLADVQEQIAALADVMKTIGEPTGDEDLPVHVRRANEMRRQMKGGRRG